MLNGRVFEVAAFGAGFATLTFSVPATRMSSDEIWAVTWLLLTNTVVRFVPFHCTAEPVTKFEPLTVNVNAGPPRVAVVGTMSVIAGGGGGPVVPPPPPHAARISSASETTARDA